MINARDDYLIATQEDLRAGLERVEGALSLKYIKSGLFPDSTAVVFSSHREISELYGSVETETTKQTHYLVARVDEQVTARRIPQRRGGELYGIDLISNPDAIMVAFGGVYDAEWLVVSQLMSSYDARSHRLYREFRHLMTKGFIRMKRYLVGPQGNRLLQSGVRFCHSVGREVWL